MKLYQPLSLYQLSLLRTNTKSEKVRFVSTLGKRMEDYEKHVARRTEEVTQLQKEWESVVREIWNLGTSCLSKSVMEDLLFTKPTALVSLSSLSEATRAASSLFVPEQDSPPTDHDKRVGKKRVTFEASELHDEEAEGAPTSGIPEFLQQPSRFQEDVTMSTPAMPEREIIKLEKKVQELGMAEMEEYSKIVRDREAFWKKKTARLARAMEED